MDDLLSALKQDHKKILRFLERIATKDQSIQQAVIRRFSDMLCAHNEAEQKVLFKQLPSAALDDTLTQSIRENERAIRIFLAELCNRSSDEIVCVKELQKLSLLLKNQMSIEERHIFPMSKNLFENGIEDNLTSKYQKSKSQILAFGVVY